MPKTLLTNRVNGKTKTYAVPATPALAEAFATEFLAGEYAIYKSVAKVGNDTVAVAPTLISVKFWADANPNNKGFANFVIPSTKTESDLFAAMVGLTLNGIKIDQVASMSQRICEKF
jgi:hypothetical protein